jgi:hypothetical protein
MRTKTPTLSLFLDASSCLWLLNPCFPSSFASVFRAFCFTSSSFSFCFLAFSSSFFLRSSSFSASRAAFSSSLRCFSASRSASFLRGAAVVVGTVCEVVVV